MDKRTKERIEREKLKNMMKENPKLLAFLEAGVELSPEDNNLVEVIKPCIEDTLEKARNDGLIMGFRTATLTMPDKLKKFNTLEDAIAWFENEAKNTRNLLGLDKEEANEAVSVEE